MYQVLKTRKGFTLLEVIIAGMIFSVVLIVSFTLYRYLIQIESDSKHIADVKNLQTSGFQAIQGIIQVQGWESFYDAYVGTQAVPMGPFYLKWDEATQKYAFTSDVADAAVIPNPLPNIDPNIYTWKFDFSTDDALGPFITSIENGGSSYMITFSKNIAPTSLPLDQILPSINNPLHSWNSSTYVVNNNTLTITLGSPTITVGDLLHPSRDLTDFGTTPTHNDSTYVKGVAVPGAGSNKGYPQLIKATVTIQVNGTDYPVSSYIRYQ